MACNDLERHAQQKLLPLYTKRRTTVKAIPKFWPVALMNHSLFAAHAQHNADQLALSYLEDLWMERDTVETRCFVLEFVCYENCHDRGGSIDRVSYFSISRKIHISRIRCSKRSTNMYPHPVPRVRRQMKMVLPTQCWGSRGSEMLRPRWALMYPLQTKLKLRSSDEL